MYFNLRKKRSKISPLTSQNPLVSVIIPLYNTENYITEAIQSIMLQTYKNFEIVIIDDCSTDSSLQIVLDLQKQNPKKKIIIKKMKRNMGTYVCINVGLQLASGELFCLLGSDDIFTTAKLQIQVNYLWSNPFAIACTSYYQRNDLSGNPITNPLSLQKEPYEYGECTTLYKKEIVAVIGYYDSVRYGADTTFFDRLKRYFGHARIGRLSKIVYYAKQRRLGLTNLKKNKKRLQYRNNNGHWMNTVLVPYISFPLAIRPFPVSIDMLP